MIPVREALDIVLRETWPLGSERVGLLQAVGRVLAESVVSTRDVPGYANSAMDGYAVRHADLATLPARLPVVGVAAAGGTPPVIAPGQAAKIMTGGPIPQGAETVVRVEDTRPDGGAVIVERAGPRGAHIRQPGEDIRSGQCVLESGRSLAPADVGLLASIGRALVLVHQRPRVAIVSTGNELVEADDAVAPGQVVNSNAYTLAAAVTEAGGMPVPLPIARDTLDDIRSVLSDAARCDACLSTGGVSVGEFDYVKQVMDEIGVRRLFWKVAQKPGKPLTFGVLDGRPWFGLPGNPVSSLVCFYLYARPALRRMMGFQALHLPSIEAVLASDVHKAEGLTEFVRCRLESRDGSWFASSTGTQSSGVLRSMSEGQGLLIGPADSPSLPAGSRARVILLGADGSTPDPPF
jgi:molybdopterin molybdotransferase